MASDYATPISVSVPMSLAARLFAEQQRQGISNRSEFLRLALQAYVAKCEANEAESAQAA